MATAAITRRKWHDESGPRMTQAGDTRGPRRREGRRPGIVICVAVVATIVRERDVVIVILPQQPGADEVDAQPERPERDRLPEGDGHRPEQTCEAFVADEESDHRKNDEIGRAHV